LELCEYGTLYNLIHDYNYYMSWAYRMRIGLDIALGLQYLHSIPIIHRDIKSYNILITGVDESSVCAKISDFGTSKIYKEKLLDRVVDNPLWLAPEIIQNIPYDLKIDTYAFGLILWETFSREKIFENVKFISKIHKLILDNIRPEMPQIFPLELKLLIQMCWAQFPEDRPSWEIIIEEIEKLKDTTELIEQEVRNYEENVLEEKKLKVEKEKEEEEGRQKNLMIMLEEMNEIELKPKKSKKYRKKHKSVLTIGQSNSNGSMTTNTIGFNITNNNL